MKKSLLALAVMAASGAAMAQSSVTLYGIVDAAATYVNGNTNLTSLDSGGQYTSRVGFRGMEDLGGGLKANFVLEGGFAADTGNGAGATGAGGGGAVTGFQFNRQSTVGLSGNFGEVRLGRELTAAYNATARYDVFGSVGLGRSRLWEDGVSSSIYGNTANGVFTTPQRVSNAITYVSPNFSGFKVAVNYAFGENAGNNTSNRYIGGGATYDNGPISVGLGLERLKQGTATNANPASTTGDISAWSLGGGYDLGVVRLIGAYRQSTASNYASSGADLKAKGYTFALTAPVGPGLVKAAYDRYQTNFVGTTAKADQFSLGYVYSLSKRTSVYGTYAYVKNKDGATLVNLNTAAGLKTNGSQSGIQVGISHAF